MTNHPNRSKTSGAGNHLIVAYGTGASAKDENFGEIVGLHELTDEQIREMVARWLIPCRDRPFTFITKTDGDFTLVDLVGDFKVVDSSGAIVESH